jgi:hypothetical protein
MRVNVFPPHKRNDYSFDVELEVNLHDEKRGAHSFYIPDSQEELDDNGLSHFYYIMPLWQHCVNIRTKDYHRQVTTYYTLNSAHMGVGTPESILRMVEYLNTMIVMLNNYVPEDIGASVLYDIYQREWNDPKSGFNTMGYESRRYDGDLHIPFTYDHRPLSSIVTKHYLHKPANFVTRSEMTARNALYSHFDGINLIGCLRWAWLEHRRMCSTEKGAANPPQMAVNPLYIWAFVHRAGHVVNRCPRNRGLVNMDRVSYTHAYANVTMLLMAAHQGLYATQFSNASDEVLCHNKELCEQLWGTLRAFVEDPHYKETFEQYFELLKDYYPQYRREQH